MTLAKELQDMKAADVVRHETVRNQFINVYNSIWKEGGEQAYEREAIYFNRQMRDNAALRSCTATSVFFSFIDLAVRGLSLAPGSQALCYLIPRSCKVGVDAQGKDIWEKVCNLTISGYGELVMRARAGQIRHADNPVIVYEGDRFEYGEQDGHKFVNYVCAVPRKSNKIVACFIRITRADGSTDYSVMTEGDWTRLQNYSAKNNRYFDKTHGQWVEKPNSLYTADEGGIDPGFLMAKCIKHAFRTYPKINIGKGTVLESDLTAEDPGFDPYAGVADEDNAPGTQQEQEKENDTFAPEAHAEGGVTVTSDDTDDGVF